MLEGVDATCRNSSPMLMLIYTYDTLTSMRCEKIDFIHLQYTPQTTPAQHSLIPSTPRHLPHKPSAQSILAFHVSRPIHVSAWKGVAGERMRLRDNPVPVQPTPTRTATDRLAQMEC